MFFRIAELPIEILFEGDSDNSEELIPSFEPFRCNKAEEPLFFRLVVNDGTRPIEKSRRTRIRDVDTGNGHTLVDSIDDGGYQFIISDINGNKCCLLVTNADFTDCRCALNGSYANRTFGLNNALMLIFAFAGCHRNLILLHASVIRKEGVGYAFTAKSGTGKSTHVSMWLSHIDGCDMMNDDNPIIRIIDGEAYIYGSPWSGKTPCYRNIKASLGAISKIVRDSSNFLEPLTTIDAFKTLLTSCSTMKWDVAIYNRICDILTMIVRTTPVYDLHCLPNKEAAIVCHTTLTSKQNCK